MSYPNTLIEVAAGSLAADVALSLSERTLVGIRGGNGAVVRVEAGLAWLTQDGDSRDWILGAGRELRLDRDGTALIQALRAATISIAAPLGRAVAPVRAALQLNLPRARLEGAS